MRNVGRDQRQSTRTPARLAEINCGVPTSSEVLAGPSVDTSPADRPFCPRPEVAVVTIRGPVAHAATYSLSRGHRVVSVPLPAATRTVSQSCLSHPSSRRARSGVRRVGPARRTESRGHVVRVSASTRTRAPGHGALVGRVEKDRIHSTSLAAVERTCAARRATVSLTWQTG